MALVLLTAKLEVAQVQLGSVPPTRSLTDIVAELTKRHAALDLAEVRAWKSEQSGRRAVGCLPMFAPREVIWAAGALPVLVRGAGERLPGELSDPELVDTCRIARSTLELGAEGWLDVLDGLIVPDTCASMGRLHDALVQDFPDRIVHALRQPSEGTREQLERWWSDELLRLYRAVCELTRRAPDAVALDAAISEYAAARMATRVLERTRVLEPWKVPVRESYLLRRAGETTPPLAYVALVGEYLRAASRRPQPQRSARRVLLMGGFCEQPPLSLLAALEHEGLAVIEDDCTPGSTEAGAEAVAARGGVLDALARAYVEDPTMSAPPRDGRHDRAMTIVERARTRGAEAVILVAASCCPAARNERLRLAARLDTADIPFLSVNYTEAGVDEAKVQEHAASLASVLEERRHT